MRPRYKQPEEREILLRLRRPGFKQLSIAKWLDVSPALVSLWFSGKRKASEQHLIALRNMDYAAAYYRFYKIPLGSP
jgi:predicted transcriptional regulator